MTAMIFSCDLSPSKLKSLTISFKEEKKKWREYGKIIQNCSNQGLGVG